MIRSTATKAAVTGGLVAFLLWKTDVYALLNTLQSLSIVDWFIAFAMFLGTVAIGAIKWKLFLPEQPLSALVALNFTGHFYGLLLPGQVAGEAVKAYRLGSGRVDAERIAASVILDRVTGLIGLIIVALCGLGAAAFPGRGAIFIVLLGAMTLLVVTLLSFRLSIWKRLVVQLQEKGGRFTRTGGQVRRLIEACEGYSGRPALLLTTIGVGGLLQLVAVWINYRLGYAIGVQLPFASWCWIFGLVSIAVVLPFTIAGIGVREGSFAGALALFNVPTERAVAVSFAVFSLLLGGALIGAALEWTRVRCPSRVVAVTS